MLSLILDPPNTVDARILFESGEIRWGQDFFNLLAQTCYVNRKLTKEGGCKRLWKNRCVSPRSKATTGFLQLFGKFIVRDVHGIKKPPKSVVTV